ncbi:hypothetical protein [Bacillus sp. 522_BSPC]|jgi:hypothetical protein
MQPSLHLEYSRAVVVVVAGIFGYNFSWRFNRREVPLSVGHKISFLPQNIGKRVFSVGLINPQGK